MDHPKTDTAKALVLGVLLGNGRVTADTLRAAGEAAGISGATMERARTELRADLKPQNSKHDTAKALILRVLGAGPTSSKALREAGEAAGIPWGTVKNARRDLVATAKVFRDWSGAWQWRLARGREVGMDHINPDGAVVTVTAGRDVTLGRGVRLGDHVTLGDGVRLGDHVTLGDGVYLGRDVTLGDYVSLGSRVVLGDDVTLGDHVTLGDGVSLGDGVHLGDYVSLGDDVHLGDYVSLGDDVYLGDGVRLGCDDIVCVGTDGRGYGYYGYRVPGGYRITAGCRDFSPAEAREHWSGRHTAGMRAEIMALLDGIDTEAARRGWRI